MSGTKLHIALNRHYIACIWAYTSLGNPFKDTQS